MSTKIPVDNDHYRVTSNDGRQSFLYKKDGGLFFPDTCIEISDHHPDGKTDSYVPDNSIVGHLLYGGKGKQKN